MVTHYFECLLRPTSWAMCRPAGNLCVSAPRHAICLIANFNGVGISGHRFFNFDLRCFRGRIKHLLGLFYLVSVD